MIDTSEDVRQKLFEEMRDNPKDRVELTRLHGQTWDTQELQLEFTVIGFLAPYVNVVRKCDGIRGRLMFQHGPPRVYFKFIPDESAGETITVGAWR